MFATPTQVLEHSGGHELPTVNNGRAAVLVPLATWLRDCDSEAKL